jgi:2-polyprenyl-3-methyl-5-hydroxy-6-metoxy-1,4-benzoquinol methylase
VPEAGNRWRQPHNNNVTDSMRENFDYVLSERSELSALQPGDYQVVLEIGCAKGGFKDSLRPGIEIWGVEPNADAAAQAAKRGYRILVGTYDEVAAQLPDSYFDLVICNDVIEHMPDHDRFLQAIKTKMRPGGSLMGSIPNVRYFGNLFKMLVMKDWQYGEQGILDTTHLRFFTEKSLARTFQRNAYEMVSLVGVNSDFQRPVTFRQILKNSLLLLLIGVTLGHCRDLQFMQFGFRLRLPA